MSDIADLQQNPYPGIDLHCLDDKTLESACLVLTPQHAGARSLHLSILFGNQYPLRPPMVQMDPTDVEHPNIFDQYICASILNIQEGYTPAYTLRGISTQLLSFFSSDKIEQQYGDVVDMAKHRHFVLDNDLDVKSSLDSSIEERFACSKCGFNKPEVALPKKSQHGLTSAKSDTALPVSLNDDVKEEAKSPDQPLPGQKLHLIDLPNDILLLFRDNLNDEDLALLSRAWDGFGRLIHDHQVVAIREIRCFTLKKSAKDALPGIGVDVDRRKVQSEFELLSQEAFFDLGVRRSVQGLRFKYWLPLPLSEQHWKRARGRIDDALTAIGRDANIEGSAVKVLYAFRNDVVVKLSQAASQLGSGDARNSRYGLYGMEQKSALTHASEKAVES